jgi:hypothetical protein
VQASIIGPGMALDTVLRFLDTEVANWEISEAIDRESSRVLSTLDISP